ncbi:MAG TPA: hypothetical protein VHZ55_02325 [Bryobacteraceae bacterium]|jgi:hypothetical protein|nr:hypothetical protein [Bryobacteraceae bacterium]
MFTGSSLSTPVRWAAFVFLLPVSLFALDNSDRWLDVEFPHDSPVLPVHVSLQEPGPTTATVRGASIVVDLHASLLLRNTGAKPISGLTLMVETPDLTPSGRGSVTVPSLHAEPGAVFPVRIDLELLRPLNMGRSKGAIMQVSLDCALFSDLSAYGPDKLHSHRMLAVYEMEARRDRRYLARLLETGQLAELREELNFGLQDFNFSQLGLELLRGPGAVATRTQPMSVSAVAFPSSPVQPIGGNAQIAGNEVQTSQLQVRNISGRPVRDFAVGWIIRDDRGQDFMAGSVPSARELAPVETVSMTQPGTLRFSRPSGQPMVVDALLAYVNDVEFSDGKMWIPSRMDIRAATSDPILRRALAASPEQQRLADVYRRKGMSGLEEELKRVN